MKMLHVTIMTTKFEEELQFYMEIVGLNVIRAIDEPGHKIRFLADKKGDTQIEIVENPNAKPMESDFLLVGFETEDALKKSNELKAQGYKVSEMIQPNPKAQFFTVKDPAGVTVQFVQED
ncbi:MAG: VOC family protein [Eubacterium sp.]|nr:VOC family protein [Eubacterium sp.]